MVNIDKISVIVKGGGDIGTGVAHRLFRCGFPVFVLDIEQPTAVRRTVSFCEAIYLGKICVEEVLAKRTKWNQKSFSKLLTHSYIPVFVIQIETTVSELTRQLHERDKIVVLVDATIAKRNTGITRKDADLVIGLGPGFIAGKDVHLVVETNRGQRLGLVIEHGSAEPDTGIPASVQGYQQERVLCSPVSGIFVSHYQIGMMVQAGEIIGAVNEIPITAQISGMLRGLLKSGLPVHAGMKLGDIDPRGKSIDIYLISDKARAIGGGVVEAILSFFHPMRLK